MIKNAIRGSKNVDFSGHYFYPSEVKNSYRLPASRLQLFCISVFPAYAFPGTSEKLDLVEVECRGFVHCMGETRKITTLELNRLK